MMPVNATTPDKNSLIKIGQLKKPYGIKGWLWLFSELDNREDIFSINSWWIKTAKGYQPLTVTKWRKQGAGLVAQFAEVTDRNIAETMNGVSIWTDKQILPRTDEDEFYWSDLIGLIVFTKNQVCLGKVKNLFATGANDVMVVSACTESIDEEERLIPWHDNTVVSVDLAKQTLIVDWQADY